MKHVANFAVSGKAAAPATLAGRHRIAINGRFLTQRTSGVQRFASEAIKAIDVLLDTDDYRALRGRIEIMAPPKARDFPLKNIPLRRCGWSNGYLWEQVEFPLHAAGALLLNLCMLGPIAVRRQLVVVHDATVKALPNNFSWRFSVAYGFLVPRLCRHAALVMTVTEFSRREIARLYGVNTDAMPICSEGGDHILAVPADDSAIERLGLTGRNFLIGVGLTTSNKNLDVVLAAFASAKLDNTSACAHRQARQRGVREIDRGEFRRREERRPRQRRRTARALRARFGAGVSFALRGLRPAADRGNDVRLPGHHQRPAGP